MPAAAFSSRQPANSSVATFVAYSPLSDIGLLTGTASAPGTMLARLAICARACRASAGRISTTTWPSWPRSARWLRRKCQRGTLTLIRLLAQGDDVTGIPGTTKAGRLAENLAAMDVTLSADEGTAIREVAKDVAGLNTRVLPGVNLFGDTPPLDS